MNTRRLISILVIFMLSGCGPSESVRFEWSMKNRNYWQSYLEQQCEEHYDIWNRCANNRFNDPSTLSDFYGDTPYYKATVSCIKNEVEECAAADQEQILESKKVQSCREMPGTPLFGEDGKIEECIPHNNVDWGKVIDDGVESIKKSIIEASE